MHVHLWGLERVYCVLRLPNVSISIINIIISLFHLNIPGFDLTTRDLYFTNNISAENTFHESYSEQNKIVALKHTTIYRIIHRCRKFGNTLINDFQHYLISLLSQHFSNIIFTEQTSPFDACDRTRTRQHRRHKFDASRK